MVRVAIAEQKKKQNEIQKINKQNQCELIIIACIN